MAVRQVLKLVVLGRPCVDKDGYAVDDRMSPAALVTGIYVASTGERAAAGRAGVRRRKNRETPL
jgi:hypothetical protein